MTIKRGLWYFALAAFVANAGFGIYVSTQNEPVHAFLHGAAAVAFGLLAIYLRSRLRTTAQEPTAEHTELLQADVDALERELRETRERLEFADQLLKKKPPAG